MKRGSSTSKSSPSSSLLGKQPTSFPQNFSVTNTLRPISFPKPLQQPSRSISSSVIATVSSIPPGTPFSSPLAANMPTLPLDVTIPYILSHARAISQSQTEYFPIITTAHSNEVPNTFYTKKSPVVAHTSDSTTNTFTNTPTTFTNTSATATTAPPAQIYQFQDTPIVPTKIVNNLNNSGSIEVLTEKIISILQTKGPLTCKMIAEELNSGPESVLNVLQILASTPLLSYCPDDTTWIFGDGTVYSEPVALCNLIGQIAQENYAVQILNSRVAKLREEQERKANNSAV